MPIKVIRDECFIRWLNKQTTTPGSGHFQTTTYSFIAVQSASLNDMNRTSNSQWLGDIRNVPDCTNAEIGSPSCPWHCAPTRRKPTPQRGARGAQHALAICTDRSGARLFALGSHVGISARWHISTGGDCRNLKIWTPDRHKIALALLRIAELRRAVLH